MNLDNINDLLQVLDKIQGASSTLLVVGVCIIVGYCLKLIKKFPNDAIPVVVIISGAALMMFLADGRPTTMPKRIWEVRNLCIGVIYGFIAWGIHYWGLSYAEQWLSSKFGKTPIKNEENTSTQPPTTKP